MTADIDDLMRRIQTLENELEGALFDRAAELRNTISELPDEFFGNQTAFRKNTWRYIRYSNLSSILTAPAVYSLIIPLLVIDIFVTAYQHICFNFYGIPKVTRSQFFVFDRRRLKYLNFIERLNCSYCSYANGVIAYIREVASLTESHWCPIKHAIRSQGLHSRYNKFAAYGDAEAYRKMVDAQSKWNRDITT